MGWAWRRNQIADDLTPHAPAYVRRGHRLEESRRLASSSLASGCTGWWSFRLAGKASLCDRRVSPSETIHVQASFAQAIVAKHWRRQVLQEDFSAVTAGRPIPSRIRHVREKCERLSGNATTVSFHKGPSPSEMKSLSADLLRLAIELNTPQASRYENAWFTFRPARRGIRPAHRTGTRLGPD